MIGSVSLKTCIVRVDARCGRVHIIIRNYTDFDIHTRVSISVCCVFSLYFSFFFFLSFFDSSSLIFTLFSSLLARVHVSVGKWARNLWPTTHRKLQSVAQEFVDAISLVGIVNYFCKKLHVRSKRSVYVRKRKLMRRVAQFLSNHAEVLCILSLQYESYMDAKSRMQVISK